MGHEVTIRPDGTEGFFPAGVDSTSFRHTERIHDRIADAQEVLGLAVAGHRTFETQMNVLANRKLQAEEFEVYLDRVLGPESRRQDGNTPPELTAA